MLLKRFAVIAIIGLIISNSSTAAIFSEEENSIQTAALLKQSAVIYDTGLESGTGFYIGPNHVLTNYHVTKGNHDIEFESQGNCSGTLIYGEYVNDLALYYTSCKRPSLTFTSDVKEGQSIMTIGNPGGEGFILSKGIVSAARSQKVYFDALVHKGNSGGPLVNMKGEVLGIVTWKSQKHDHGIAIESAYIEKFLERTEIYGSWP